MNAPLDVLLTHPGMLSLIYETVRAVQDMPVASRFETGFYYHRDGMLRRFVEALPAPMRHRLDRELSRRTHPDLDETRIHNAAFAEFVFRLSNRLPLPDGWRAPIGNWRIVTQDRHAARRVAKLKPRLVIGWDNCCVESFEAAAKHGGRRLLNQVIGQVGIGAATLREEAQRQPDWADSMPFQVSDEWIARSRREILSAERIIVPSDYVRDSLIETGADPDRIRLIPYGVATTHFAPAEPRADGVFRAIYVGQLSQRKGLSYLLEAWRGLASADTELVLLGNIVGSGRGLETYRGLYRHVRNVPHAEVANQLRTADVMVFPSLHEGSPLSVLEAMACGLPVIATPNAGTLIRDGHDGFIVPVRDPDAIAEKLAQLRDDTDLRRRMGAAARETALAHDWQRFRSAFSTEVADLLA